jgi:hypothetical protein
LGLLDRQHWAIDVAALYGSLPAGATGYSVTLVPKRSVPTSGNTWTATTYANGIATILLAGPNADSTGALVVTGDADLWILPVGGTDAREVKVGRITVPGVGQVAASLPPTYVTSINGLSGNVTIGFAVVDNGDGTLSTDSSAVTDNGDGTLTAA